MTTCEYDAGSMFGNVPLCSERATWSLTYRNGSYGPFTIRVCDGHALPMEGRVFPASVRVVALVRPAGA